MKIQKFEITIASPDNNEIERGYLYDLLKEEYGNEGSAIELKDITKKKKEKK